MKNQPAFPQPEPIVNEFHKDYGKDRGMTLRDYFAAKAMQSMVEGKGSGSLEQGGYTAVSMMAYKMADAMMKARE
jgi:hypothetical protein